MKALEELFLRSWWIILFILACGFFYEQSIKSLNEERAALIKQLSTLKMEKEEALKAQNDLSLKLNSQSDPAWVELTLLKVLGLVPEGQQKVLLEN